MWFPFARRRRPTKDSQTWLRRNEAPARLAFEPLEDRTVPAFLAPVDYPAGTYPGVLAAADFNNDAVPDLAVARSGNTVGVLLGRGDGTFQAAINSATGSSPVAVAAGDFNADGNLDLVTANAGSGDASALLGHGDGTFAAPQSLAVNPAVADTPSAVAVGDLNGDGAPDIAVTSHYLPAYEGGGAGGWWFPEGYLTVFAGDGAGGFAAGESYYFGYQPTSLRLADVNGDGALDAVAADVWWYGVDVMLGGPGGTLVWWDSYVLGFGARSVDVGDLDGDGRPDLVVADANGVSILAGDGQGYFEQVNASGPHEVELVALADFDNDGNLDVATEDFVLLGRGDATFAPPIGIANSLYPWGLAAADLDGDGWLDLATGSGGNAAVFINDRVWPATNAPSVAISDVTVTEGNAGAVYATFTISLSSASTTPVSVRYATANGTATAGSDYQSQGGTVTFAPGETARTITVPINGDRLGEANETFFVNLSTADAFLADGQGIGTILDDEPRISINDAAKQEGPRGGQTLFVFTVSLSSVSGVPVTVNFTTANGTAEARQDYQAQSGTLTFAPGETTKTITIVVKGDNKKEASETFFLDLDEAANAFVLDDQGLGTILNDD